MGIYGGAALTGLVGVMFLYSILAQSADATYAVLYLLMNPALIFISYLYYETAHAYYIPQTHIVRKEKVEEEEEEEEEDKKDEDEGKDIEEEKEEDNSPFVSFLLVSM